MHTLMVQNDDMRFVHDDKDLQGYKLPEEGRRGGQIIAPCGFQSFGHNYLSKGSTNIYYLHTFNALFLCSVRHIKNV